MSRSLTRLTSTSSVGRVRSFVQQGERVCTQDRAGGLERGDEVGQEPPQVGVALVQGQPRHATALAGRACAVRREPLGHERCLAEPGRCRDQHQPRHRPGFDPAAGR